MANLQQALQKATFATVMTTDKLLSMKNDPKNTSLQIKELITNNVDVVALLGHAAHELSHLRREKLKPALKPGYHALCSPETLTASSKYLFGTILPNRYGMPKKQIVLEMQSARQSTTPGRCIETLRGLTGVTTLTKVGRETGSIFWGKVPTQQYGKSTTTAKRKARRSKTIHHSTKKFGK